MPHKLIAARLALLGLDPSHRPALRLVSVHLAILAVMMLGIWWMPTPPGVKGVAGYGPLHTFFETISVIVCALMFAVTWNAPRRHLAGNMVLLACAFAGVAVLDFSHLLSIQGMPDYVTPSDPEKAIDFWLAARLLAATALLTFASCDPHRQYSTAVKYAVLMAVVVAIVMVHVLVLIYPQWIPRTFIKRQGLSEFKRAAEYGLIGLNMAAIVCLWWQMRKPLPYNAAAVVGAIAAMGMSEFFLTLYSDVTDIYLVAGHVYKVISYLYLYRAIFVESITRPYLELHQSREALQRSREDLGITLNSIGDAVIATDAQGLVTRMNPVAERLTGWPLADAIGQPLTAVFHIFSAETGLTAVNPVQQVMEHGQVVGLANGTALLARGGQEYRIADSAAPIRDASNTIVGVVLVFSDATEKYQTDTALRVANSQLATFFSHAPVAVAMFDVDMRYLFASRRWQQDYAIADRALRGVSHYEVFPEITEVWRAVHQRALAGETVRAEEDRFERSDGTVQWLHWEIRPWHEPGGEIGGVLLFTEDITKRKVAEDALHESEILGRAILDSVSAEIAVLDNEGTIVAVNAPWQRFASENSMVPGDPAPGTGVGSNYLAVCRADDGADHDDSARNARQGIQAVLSGDLPSFTLEHPCHAPDLQRWFSMSATPLDITGPGGGVVVAHTDITLRKLAELALQAALKEKTALLNEVHHRVKNNLQVVTSLLRLERGRNTHAPTQAVLNDMQGRIRAMALLHESIYRAGTFAAIDLGAYASEIATQAFASLRTGTGTLRLRLDLSPLQVGLDQATTCGLLLTELISNALKHGFPDGGSGAIRIVLQPVVAPRTGSEIDQWRLRVSDTGVGLPANFAARQQESLGMQLAYGLASQLGGTLEAGPGDAATGSTKPGASFGVTFTVTPPATLAIDLQDH